MDNVQVIKKLASSPGARTAAREAAQAFLGNVIRYPVLFSRCNHMIMHLPASERDEISIISSKSMKIEDAERITRILDDNTCATCGKVKGKCSHGAT